MGFAPNVIRLMLRLHGQKKFSGPVLTLGVQDVCVTYPELQSMFREEKSAFAEVPPNERQPGINQVIQENGRGHNKFVHPRTFFRTLGISDYEDLDFSEREGPCLIHDLNQPIPESWKGRYGWVIDGGTLEHIFDVRTAMANLISLLKVGGNIVHISPVSGWVNHGFYQLNPCLFYDFYQHNGFHEFASFLVQIPRGDGLAPGKIVPYQHVTSVLEIDDKAFRYLFVFAARKKTEGPLRIPTQGFYQNHASPKLSQPTTDQKSFKKSA